ncbi:MAG: universal stress protein [Magnetospirillum sp. WYHS-4]
MQKILVAVDGSKSAKKAVEFAIDLVQGGKKDAKLYLLTVQPPITFGNIKKFVKKKALEGYYEDQGKDALKEARDLAEKEKIDFSAHIKVGPVAEAIVDFAKDKDCALIVVGTRGLGKLAGMLVGSVAMRVVHLSAVPVALVK